MKLHHIGIIVNNIQTSLGELSRYLKFEKTSIPMLVESQNVNVCFLKTKTIFHILKMDKNKCPF